MAQHTFHPIDQKLIAELIGAEIAAGRHTAAPTQLCCDCGRFVQAIYHLEGRKCWCGPCADEFGQGPQSILRRQQQQGSAGGAGITGPSKAVEVYSYSLSHPEVT
jgi:hypothetical protein